MGEDNNNIEDKYFMRIYKERENEESMPLDMLRNYFKTRMES
jgi:hypothetical protein